MGSEWSGAIGIGEIVWCTREFDGVAARIWSNGDWQVHGRTAADLAAARAMADRVLALVHDNAQQGQAPADPDTELALVSDLRTAAATLRAAGLTPDGAACVALVETMRRERAVAQAPAFGAACVEAAEEERWPRWVGGRLWLSAEDQTCASHVAYALALDNNNIAWRSYAAPTSMSPIAEGIEYGDNAIESAMDCAEAALRASGILAPGVKVWR